MGPSQVARHIMDNEDKLHDLQTKMLDTKSMLKIKIIAVKSKNQSFSPYLKHT